MLLNCDNLKKPVCVYINLKNVYRSNVQGFNTWSKVREESTGHDIPVFRWNQSQNKSSLLHHATHVNNIFQLEFFFYYCLILADFTAPVLLY